MFIVHKMALQWSIRTKNNKFKKGSNQKKQLILNLHVSFLLGKVW